MAVAIVVVAVASASLQEVETFLKWEQLFKPRDLSYYCLPGVVALGFTSR
jgi:hypothetical protein